MINKRSILLFAFLCLALNSKAQNAVFTVLDSEDKLSVPNAHLVFHELDGKGEVFGVANGDGRLEVELKFRAILEISFIGYRTLIDTVYPGEKKTFFLSPDPFGLDEVVVTAQYAPESERNSVYRVHVLGQRQIENRAAVNVADLLANQLNIRLSQDNAIGSTGIDIMGLGGENVKILMDGVPLVGRLNGVIDLNQVNLNNIERVELIEGPVSVSYGSNALGGVINLISKSPEKNNLKLNLNSYYESVGQYNFDGLAEFSGKKDAVQLSGGRNFFDGFSTSDRNRGDDWNLKEQFFGKGLYQNRLKRGNLKFSSNAFYEIIKDKGEINTQNLAFDQHYRTTRWINDLSINGSTLGGAYYEAFVAYSYYERKRNAYVKDMETLEVRLSEDPSKHDTAIFHSIASRSNWSSDIVPNRLSYQAGYDLNYELGLGERIREGQQSITDIAAFASIKLSTGSWLVQPALRMAYNTKYDAPLIPSLNLKYNVSENVSFRFSYARGFRAPSLKELYLDFVDANHNVQGNDSLLAERSHSFNISSAYYFGRGANMFKLEPSVWYNHIEDKIQLVYVGPGPADYSNTNIGDLKTAGGKVQFHTEIHPRFHLKVGYALLGKTDWTTTSNSDVYYLTNEWNGTISYISMPQKWGFSIFYKWTGESPQPVLDDTGELSVRNLEAYQMLDITFTKRFWEEKIKLSLGGKNLFNVTNLNLANGSGGVHAGANNVPISWGRTFFVALKLNLDHAIEL